MGPLMRCLRPPPCLPLRGGLGQVVKLLDKYIIGQQDAKKAVAVALRNRWRRVRLPPELKPEVVPKNILMIGPTGCGKTEIARRLAKLADAPFVKVPFPLRLCGLSLSDARYTHGPGILPQAFSRWNRAHSSRTMSPNNF